MELRGARCSIRHWRKTDLPALIKHANNLNVARQLRDRFPNPYTEKDARAFLKHATADTSNLAIAVNDEAVGAVGFVPGRDIERYSAEVGYWLSEEFWGRGIASEALALLTGYLFNDLNYLRLFAVPFADNTGSIRVLEKSGYVKEAVLAASSVKYGIVKDQLLYARINPDWKPPDSLRA